MPRTSDKSDALRDIETFIKSATCDYLLASTSSEEEDAEEDIEDLLCIHEVLVSYRYLSRGNGAGRHGDDSLEAYIHQYPDPAFLTLFRMHRASFWQVDTSSNRQKKAHFCSKRSLIDFSLSSDLTPHPERSCMAFAPSNASSCYLLSRQSSSL